MEVIETAPEILIPKKNIILDSQILSSWIACKRLTDFRFNMNLVSIHGKGNSLEAGSLAHEILKVYYQGVRDAKPRSVSIEDAFKAGELYYKGDANDEKNFPGLKNTPIDNEGDKDDKRISYNHVVKTMREYFLYYANESWIPIDIEKVHGSVIYEDEEVRVMWKAKFDLRVDTNQGIYPVDHKTAKQRRNTLSLNNQFMGQCVLNKSNAMIIDKIGWQKTLKPSEKFSRPMMSYSTDRLKEWVDLVGFYAKEIIEFNELGFFPPNFSHCDKYSGCQFKEVCEQDRNMREYELRRLFIVGEPWEPEDE